MSLLDVVNESRALTPQEKLTLGILINENLTTRQMIDCLMGDPYDLTFDEVCKALDGLNEKGLIRIAAFELRKNAREFSSDVYLTFATALTSRITGIFSR